jgi:hypothetical protein
MTKILTLLAALIAATILSPSAHSSPVNPCCFNPKNQWDERCVGARFERPPGYNVDDPGTWSGYSPWQGGCNSVGDSSNP